MQVHGRDFKVVGSLFAIFVLAFVALTSGSTAAPVELCHAVKGNLISLERLDRSMSTDWNDSTSIFLSTADEDMKVLLAFKGETLTASAQDGPPTVSISVTPEKVKAGDMSGWDPIADGRADSSPSALPHRSFAYPSFQ
jgi:hypothetical protein